jgi:hypothetical protein
MEIADIIKMSAGELLIDGEKDVGTQQINRKDRERVIGCVDILLDRELYFLKDFIDDVYDKEMPENEDDLDDIDFDDSMDEVQRHLVIIKRLAMAREYLGAWNIGTSGDL